MDYWQNTLVHIVEAHRLRGYTFPRQCEILADLATRLGIPVAVEDNHIQGAYGEEINRRFPWVKTICHTTSDNKRDPVQGVETFAPLFARDRIVIHARGAPPDNIAALRTEFAQWTGRDSRHTTDVSHLNFVSGGPFPTQRRTLVDFLAVMRNAQQLLATGRVP